MADKVKNTQEKRWERPRIEEVVLEPSEDVLGTCPTSSTATIRTGVCRLTSGCYHA
jgi:hypothetical protein